MIKVNLLIIGAARSGTTSLYHWLKNHPDICFSIIKEVHFFSIDELFKQGKAYLHSFFPSYKGEENITIADTYLLIDTKAPKRILKYNPEMKFIVVLRNPVERAYSAYHYAVNNGYENPKINFIQTMYLEEERLKNDDIVEQNNLGNFYGGLYFKHLSYWMQYFPKKNFFLLTTNELKVKPAETLKNICNFLEISPFVPSTRNKDFKQYNKISSVKLKYLRQILVNRNNPFRKILRKVFPSQIKYLIIKSGIIDFIHQLNKRKAQYLPLSPKERQIADKYFDKDLKRLKEEFNISFTHPLNPPLYEVERGKPKAGGELQFEQ